MLFAFSPFADAGLEGESFAQENPSLSLLKEDKATLPCCWLLLRLVLACYYEVVG